MDEECVSYDGRKVPRWGFRAFIYGSNGQTRLVNSWEEYEEHIKSGIWSPVNKRDILAEDKQVLKENIHTKKRGK